MKFFSGPITIEDENRVEFNLIVKEIRFLLKKQERELRKLCHVNSCNKIYFCPVDHYECSKKLNVSTSLFWVLADLLKYIDDILYEDSYWFQIQHTMIKIELILYVFSFHYEILNSLGYCYAIRDSIRFCLGKLKYIEFYLLKREKTI